jgi:excinuclease UvrABC nuclease subunit
VRYSSVELKLKYLDYIPAKPGIYRFLTDKNDILYIGASNNLKNRILQHYSNINNNSLDRKYHALKEYSRRIEFRCFPSAEEAFEAERIELWTQQPPFNRKGVRILSYSYLIVRELPFPMIICVPKDKKNEIRDYDTFYRVNINNIKLSKYIRVLRKFFPFCFPSSNGRCWDNQLGLCHDECRSREDVLRKETGNKNDVFINCISNTDSRLISHLEDRLAKCVEDLKFEQAQKVLNAVKILKEIRIRTCRKGFFREIDQFTFDSEEPKKVKVTSISNELVIKEIENSIEFIENITQEFMLLNSIFEFYQKSSWIPPKIQLNFGLSFKKQFLLEKWINRYHGQQIEIETK